MLTLLAAIYRKWAAYRLESLREWIETWADKDLFSIDAGSEEAWWTTAIEIEEAILKGEEVIGGAADLEKAFDQIQRPLLTHLLKEVGMSERILDTYMRFAEHLIVQNAIGDGLGHAYKRKCSIPQGCPMSMLMMAFILKPWVSMMQSKEGACQ